AGDGGDDTGCRRYLADALVGVVGDVQVAAAVHHHPERVEQAGRCGRAAIAAVAVGAVAGNGGDDAGRQDDLADVAAVVADEQVACAVQRHSVREVQLGRAGLAAVPGEAGDAGAGDGDDVAGRLDDLADAVVALVGEEDVAAAVHRHPVRGVQRGGGRCDVVAVVPLAAVAGDRDDVGGRLGDGEGIGAADRGADGVLQ